MCLSIFAWMIHLSLAFLHLHVQEILLDLIVTLWARTVIMLFLVLPSLQLLHEEAGWDVLLRSSLLWGFQAWSRRKCTVHTCKCLFQSPLVEILPAELQQSTFPEKLTSVLGLIWDLCCCGCFTQRFGVGISWFGFVLGVFLGFLFFVFFLILGIFFIIPCWIFQLTDPSVCKFWRKMQC